MNKTTTQPGAKMTSDKATPINSKATNSKLNANAKMIRHHHHHKISLHKSHAKVASHKAHAKVASKLPTKPVAPATKRS